MNFENEFEKKEYLAEMQNLMALKTGVESIIALVRFKQASPEEKTRAISIYNEAVKKYKEKWGDKGDDFDYIEDKKEVKVSENNDELNSKVATLFENSLTQDKELMIENKKLKKEIEKSKRMNYHMSLALAICAANYLKATKSDQNLSEFIMRLMESVVSTEVPKEVCEM